MCNRCTGGQQNLNTSAHFWHAVSPFGLFHSNFIHGVMYENNQQWARQYACFLSCFRGFSKVRDLSLRKTEASCCDLNVMALHERHSQGLKVRLRSKHTVHVITSSSSTTAPSTRPTSVKDNTAANCPPTTSSVTSGAYYPSAKTPTNPPHPLPSSTHHCRCRLSPGCSLLGPGWRRSESG